MSITVEKIQESPAMTWVTWLGGRVETYRDGDEAIAIADRDGRRIAFAWRPVEALLAEIVQRVPDLEGDIRVEGRASLPIDKPIYREEDGDILYAVD